QVLFARGSYLVNAIANCNDCHTNPSRDFMSPLATINTAQFLTGGAVFEVPPPLNMITHTERTMSANLIGEQFGFLSRGGDLFTFIATLTEGVHAQVPSRPPLGF